LGLVLGLPTGLVTFTWARKVPSRKALFHRSLPSSSGVERKARKALSHTPLLLPLPKPPDEL
jgi:hypothetical protein